VTTSRFKARAWFFIPLSLMALVPPASAKESGCAAIGKLVPYCGLSHPEDLEVLPGGAGVITSDMHMSRGSSGLVGQPGSLKFLDLKSGAVTALYPSRSTSAGRSTWGDPNCPGEIGAVLLPHGIHLSRRNDGAWQLLVVNHGGRESVEFFELTGSDKSWSLSWRGCVIPPAPNRLNDVVGLADGSLLVTTMDRLGNQPTQEARDRALQGENTGFLWRWTPGKGLSEQPGSAAPRPNGVQIDAAGRYAYLSTATKGGEVRKIDLVRGEVVGAVLVPHPDNSAWASDGRLLVAGVAANAEATACFAAPEEPCPVAFEVHAIDPATMRGERLFAHSGPPMGAATVAVQHGPDLLIGSFVGDRILAVRDLFVPGSRTGRSAP
jgi:hypothetical protein